MNRETVETFDLHPGWDSAARPLRKTWQAVGNIDQFRWLSRADVLEHLRMAREELGVRHVRAVAMYSPEMKVWDYPLTGWRMLADPVFTSMRTCEVDILWLSTVSVANPIEMEGHEEMRKQDDLKNTFNPKPYSVVPWAEVTVYRWGAVQKVEVGMASKLNLWFKRAKWGGKESDIKAVGLESEKTIIFEDSIDSKLVWHLKLYAKNYGIFEAALKCADGISQARPDVKSAAMDSELVTALWKLK